jgi:hypothetical protein
MDDDQPQGDSTTRAANAIKELLAREGVLPAGAYVSSCIVVAAVAEATGGQRPRTALVYPLGVPDPQTERGLLERALDALRGGGDL